jgi:jumonji domain-containing protein 7
MPSNEEQHEQQRSPPSLLVASSTTLASFHDNVQYLWLQDIPIYDEPPSSIEFMKNHVLVSRPCIIRNAILMGNKQALTLTADEILTQYPQQKMNVDVTPDGHGDCLRKVVIVDGECRGKEIFVEPMTMEMTMKEFVTGLRTRRKTARTKSKEKIMDRTFPISTTTTTTTTSSSAEGTTTNKDSTRNDDDDGTASSLPPPNEAVFYYSRQNDCLRQELPQIWNHRLKKKEEEDDDDDDGRNHNDNKSSPYVFPRSFDWACEAFSSKEPDAINLWIGNQDVTSSIHKDYYENLFYVLDGEKLFSLCPPSDVPFLYETSVQKGQFTLTDRGQWEVTTTVDDDTVHWITADVFEYHKNKNNNNNNNNSAILDRYPLLQYTHPVPNISVKAGEMIYIPSLWFHQVTQSCETVGINYWYDMNFSSPLYCYYNLLEQLTTTVANGTIEEEANVTTATDEG